MLWSSACRGSLGSTAAPPYPLQGYNVADFLQRYHAHSPHTPTNRAWHKVLLSGPKRSGRVRYGCGLCNSCKGPAPRSRQHVPVSVHAVEMVSLNVNALRRLFAAFHVPGTVHHLAISNRSGFERYSTATAVGLEHLELGKGPVSGAGSQRVRVDTLDSFTRAQGIERVGLLSVDAEGQDALVLEGAEQLLASRRVDVLEFEFIGRGYWRRDHPEQRQLSSVLAALDRQGYACFWQADNGRLARAGGRFWCDNFRFRFRSNLVCSHVPRIVEVFGAMAVS